MGNYRFIGEAAAVAQVDTFTPGGSIEIGDIFILTITGWNGRTVAISYSAAATTVADVCTGLAAAWNASTDALCTPITAADNTTNITLTADTAGEAFSVAGTTTEAGGGAADAQTFSKASTTASAGPKHWDSVDNWDAGAVPDGAHVVYLENWSGDILYGLDQSAITALTSLNISQTFTGSLGVDAAAGELGTYLQTKTAILNVGYHTDPGSPAGSPLMMIDLGSAQACQVTIDNTGTSSDSYRPPLRLKAANASTDIFVNKGTVGIAFDTTETSTIGDLSISYETNVNSDATVYLGAGVTVTTIDKDGGTLYTESGATTLTNYRGNIYTHGTAAFTTINHWAGNGFYNATGAIATFNSYGGTSKLKGTGTITALNVLGGYVSTYESQDSRTITTAKIEIDGIFDYIPANTTLTNKLQGNTSTQPIKLTAAAP